MGLAILNLNRKLYVSDANINQALDGMEKLDLDVLIGVEPGQTSLFQLCKNPNPSKKQRNGSED